MTPYFSTLNDFVQMGGHGTFVWASYAISFVAIFGLIWFVKHERKRTITRLNQQLNARPTRLTNKQRQELGNQRPSV